MDTNSQYLPKNWVERIAEECDWALNEGQGKRIMEIAEKASKDWKEELRELRVRYEDAKRNIEAINKTCSLIEEMSLAVPNSEFITLYRSKVSKSEDNATPPRIKPTQLAEELRLLRNHRLVILESIESKRNKLESYPHNKKVNRSLYWDRLFIMWLFGVDPKATCSFNKVSRKHSGKVVNFVRICSEVLFEAECEPSMIVTHWSGRNGRKEAIRAEYRRSKRLMEKVKRAIQAMDPDANFALPNRLL